VRPGGEPVCDGRNNDCDDPAWPAVPLVELDLDGDSRSTCQGDCDDTDFTVAQGAPQLCDGQNNDCDDPSWPAVPIDEADLDEDGFAECAGDCDDLAPNRHPDALEICNQIDDDCDGQVDEDEFGTDSDGDAVHNACDNCPLDRNPTQGDVDGDLEGDTCDTDDGLIWVSFVQPEFVEWQLESGYDSWNLYRGDLGVLAQTGEYTQPPGSNALAERLCDLGASFVADLPDLQIGQVAFYLVSGNANSSESDLGSDGSGVPRPNSSPCH